MAVKSKMSGSEVLVSVLLPVRNGEKYISAALESVLRQTFRNFEIIIINDGSTDNTLDAIKAFNDKRIKVFNSPDTGLVGALNHGLKKCKGTYIARMDSDDICMPNRIIHQVRVLDQNPEIGVVCSNIKIIDELGQNIGYQKSTNLTTKRIARGLTFRAPMKPIIHPSVMIRRELLKDLKGYRHYESAEDRDLWLRLLPRTKFYTIKTPLLQYRINKNSISQQNYIQQKTNSMTAILCYEVLRQYGVDLYLHQKETLAHFYKYFNVYISKSEKINYRFKTLKSSFNENKYFGKMLVLAKIMFNIRIVTYVALQRHNDRKQIEIALKLASNFLNLKKLNS